VNEREDKMPLKITQRRAEEVPQPSKSGKVNEELQNIKAEMSKLREGMILEIDAGASGSVRSAKSLITRASKELGRPWTHWHQGTKVYAKPLPVQRRRGRPPRNPAA
jgi:hypothetical protein